MKPENIQAARDYILNHRFEADIHDYLKTDEFKILSTYDDDHDVTYLVLFPNSGFKVIESYQGEVDKHDFAHVFNEDFEVESNLIARLEAQLKTIQKELQELKHEK